MDTEIICTLISSAGVVLSALIAWLVSRSSAKKEIEKMKLEWEREDVVSSDDDFGQLSAAVSRYVMDTETPIIRKDAVAFAASMRARENGTLAELLDALYTALVEAKPAPVVENALVEVIKEQRIRKGQPNGPNGHQPKH